MPIRQVQNFLDELSVRILAADRRGFTRMIHDPLFLIGEEGTEIRAGGTQIGDGLDRLSLRLRMSGWDGFEITVREETALGAAALFVEGDAHPLYAGGEAGPDNPEGYLFYAGLEDPALFGVVNSGSLRWWSGDGAGPEPGDGDAIGAEEAMAVIGEVVRALRSGDLGAYLACVAMPFAICSDDEAQGLSTLSQLEGLLTRFSGPLQDFRSYDMELLSLRPLGDRLTAARCLVHAVDHDGGRRDPWTNFYILRRTRDGLRVALIYAGGIGSVLPGFAQTERPQ